MTWAAFIALARQYWPQAAVIALVVLGYLYIQQSGELKACKSAMEAVKLEVKQNQDMGGKLAAKTGLQGKITLPKCPPAAVDGQGKCPPCEGAVIDFTAVADAYAEGKASQSQSVTVTPSLSPVQGHWGILTGYHFQSRLLSVGPTYKFSLFSIGAGVAKPVNDQIFQNFDNLDPFVSLVYGPF